MYSTRFLKRLRVTYSCSMFCRSINHNWRCHSTWRAATHTKVKLFRREIAVSVTVKSHNLYHLLIVWLFTNQFLKNVSDVDDHHKWKRSYNKLNFRSSCWDKNLLIDQRWPSVSLQRSNLIKAMDQNANSVNWSNLHIRDNRYANIALKNKKWLNERFVIL